jgi:hypothetical protein
LISNRLICNEKLPTQNKSFQLKESLIPNRLEDIILGEKKIEDRYYFGGKKLYFFLNILKP